MKENKKLGSILLISGVTIGAGMLGLPIKTGIGGFFPALVCFTVCWFAMFWTSLLFLEINISLNIDNINLISMAKKTLGRKGEVLMWVIYLLQLNALIVAYLDLGGEIILKPIKNAIFIMPSFLGQIFILIIFGPFIYFGLKSVIYLNKFLMNGLIITFILMIIFIMPNIKFSNLMYVNYNYSLMSMAVIITSFGFHIIIPSIISYLDKDIRKMKTVLLMGTLIPLIFYIIWEFLILGSVPAVGLISINTANVNGIDISQILHNKLNNNIIDIFTNLFSIFAISTSLIGVSKSLFDFWTDGLRFNDIEKSKKIIFLLTFMPSLIIIICFDANFLIALEYAGIFIAILLGIFPILMVWKIRYCLQLSNIYTVRGGKLSLIFGLLFFCSIILLVFIGKFK